MMRIVQIAPTIEPGTGVAGVAFHLEREFAARGATVERFTMAEAGRGPRRTPRSALAVRLQHGYNVIWFSTVGTARARRFLAERPDAVSICHNDAMVGDIYVNHGLLQVAMRTRGHYVWRMLRNPLHLFTAVRDRIRYRGAFHRAIVTLTEQEAGLLVDTYRHVNAPIHVIPNGVDLERFRPASDVERRDARADLGLADDGLIAVFIGHEFERKGLPFVVEGLKCAPEVTLVVVGGTPDQIRRASGHAARLGVRDRVRFVGPKSDPTPFLRASDVFVLPSAYESYGLVIMEALASGLPVVATSVGVVPEVLVDGVNGFIVPPNATTVGPRLRELSELSEQDLGEWRRRARASAVGHPWRSSADRYLALVDQVHTARGSR
jgi:UDP-glucose:(heptosyl)LPS alpha-1,3-glucosyltransferase